MPMVFVALLPLKRVASAETQPQSSTCINRLLECDQSLKLGLLWILDLQSLTASDLLSFIEPQNSHLHLRMYPKVC